MNELITSLTNLFHVNAADERFGVACTIMAAFVCAIGLAVYQFLSSKSKPKEDEGYKKLLEFYEDYEKHAKILIYVMAVVLLVMCSWLLELF